MDSKGVEQRKSRYMAVEDEPQVQQKEQNTQRALAPILKGTRTDVKRWEIRLGQAKNTISKSKNILETTAFLKYGASFFLAIVLLSCGGPEPRRPKKVNSGSYFKESIERSKNILAQEEALMQEIIKNDTAHSYTSSASGSWYYYDVKNEAATYLPKADDLVTLAYNLVSFENDTLYSMKDIGVQVYKVDKQELFPGLRNSVKLLKEGEVATFLFPSSLAYGYPGDGDKIGVNMPLKSTISILKVVPKSDSETDK